MLELTLRAQKLESDGRGRNVWRTVEERAQWPCASTALLLCDVWDSHWCRGAVERLEQMLPRMNAVAERLRQGGALVVHAPSDTMDFYAGHPARQRLKEAPPVEPPPERSLPDPPLPVDASDHGADTGETDPGRRWSRQHPGIGIDAERDIISADGREIYSFLHSRGIERLLIMGVHTNMCVLHRSFAIKQMVRWGVQVALLRDLTDAMYNPARPPYVSHEQGTQLVVGYIEKFWCPTVLSEELLGARG